MNTKVIILEANIAYGRGDQLEHTAVAATFDVIGNQAAARACGKQLGEAIGDALALKFQQGKLPR